MGGGVFVDVVAPVIGAILANVMFLSPLRSVLQVRRDRKLGDLNPLPFPVIMTNTLLWIAYAYHLGDWYLVFANTPGALLGVFFTLVCYAAAEGRTAWLLEVSLTSGMGLVIVVGWIATKGLGNDEDARGLLIGLTAVTVLVLYYSSPLTTLMQVVRKRDASSILYPLAVASTINGGAWTVYGLFGIQDPLVWGPNLAGAMLGVVQLVLRAVYGAGSKGQASSSESTSEYYSGQEDVEDRRTKDAA